MKRIRRSTPRPAVLALLVLGSALSALASCGRGPAPTPVPTPDFVPTIESVVGQRIGRALDDRVPAIESTVSASVARTVIAILPTPLPALPTPAVPPTPTPLPVTPTPAAPPTPTAPVVTPTPTAATPSGGTPTATPPTSGPTATPTPVDLLAVAGASIVQVEQRPSVTATGVIVEASPAAGTALVLTNAHVTASSRQIDVVVGATRRITGKVIGEDKQRDLALIEICCGAFSAIPVSGTTNVPNGSVVGIVGYPSASTAELQVTTAAVLETRYKATSERYEVLIDLLLTPELSGSALFDSAGRFVGLATYSVEAASGGAGFAIAPTTIVAALPSLRDGPVAVTATPTPSVATSSGIVFGPATGILSHNPSGGEPVIYAPGIDVADMIIVATFTNPYATSEGSWSYGFRFRAKGLLVWHTVFVRSDGAWRHWLLDDQGNPLKGLQTQSSAAIDVATNANNTLRVMAIGSEGFLFINSTFVGKLDLSGLTRSGDFALVTGFFANDQIAGKTTPYKDVTVTRVGAAQPYPQGMLVRSTPGFVTTDSTGVNLADSVVDVRFTNPASPWSYGLLLRQTGVNTFHAAFIASDGYWYHHTRTGTVPSDAQLKRLQLASISTAAGGTNRLQFFASGSSGWFFVNGEFAGLLDLGAVQAPGDIRLMAGYFSSDQSVGVQTRFDPFSVRWIR